MEDIICDKHNFISPAANSANWWLLKYNLYVIKNIFDVEHIIHIQAAANTLNKNKMMLMHKIFINFIFNNLSAK